MSRRRFSGASTRRRKPKCRSTCNKNRPNPRRNKYHSSYDEIKEKLKDLLVRYPDHIQVEPVGCSQEGRTIFIAFVSRNAEEFPKNAVFIEAGSNGRDHLAVASALYIIEHLCKTVQTSKLLKIMDCFVIPCSNPDAYEATLKGRKPRLNLARCFPFKLGQYSLDDIGEAEFLRAAKTWKENQRFDASERSALVSAISAYQFATKLFVSLQEEGEMIAFPFGATSRPIGDADELARVARIGRSGAGSSFRWGSIYQLCGLTFGTVVDFLRTFSAHFKYSYIVHMNDRGSANRADERASRVLCCITKMAKEVYDAFNVEKQEVSPPKSDKFIRDANEYT
ncbi:unnamed protein product [Phyllotreta striolata]|uniref:Peptidase M14 domain-containing protein n=1 Tax=Phyllotreta striolata TaxID=444603 RepID=A0A9N9TSP2_PHYSR|nr:unnamed protein product [Phyllotreta striolata]